MSTQTRRLSDHLLDLFCLSFVAVILILSRKLGLSLYSSAGLVICFGALALFIYFIFKVKIPQSASSGFKLGTSKIGMVSSTIVFNPDQFRHILVTGTTGVGKSTFLRQFISEVLLSKSPFIYIDFKGEQADYDELCDFIEIAGIKDQLQVFDLSDPSKCATLNPLLVFDSVEDTTNFILPILIEKSEAHIYYYEQAREFISQSISLMDYSGTPRTLELIYHLLTDGRVVASLLKKLPSQKAIDTKRFFDLFLEKSERDKDQTYSGLRSSLKPFFSDSLKRVFNSPKNDLNLSELFSKDLSAIIRVPGERYGELSKKIVQSFMKLLPILMAARRLLASRKHYYIIFDEGCSYLDESIVDTLKKAGSAKVHLLVTRMCDGDFEKLGTGVLDSILSSFGLFVTFQTIDPDTREKLSRISGTLDAIKNTRRVSHGSNTGEESERDVQKFKVNPQQFYELSIGECMVISSAPIPSYGKMKVFKPNIKKFKKEMETQI